MVSYLKNQSLNLTSELSDNQKPSLEESFESYIKARYGYDTKLGRCLFTLLALIHLKSVKQNLLMTRILIAWNSKNKHSCVSAFAQKKGIAPLFLL
jgi:hypothetical protein